jgi:hypothetical protein
MILKLHGRRPASPQGSMLKLHNMLPSAARDDTEIEHIALNAQPLLGMMLKLHI